MRRVLHSHTRLYQYFDILHRIKTNQRLSMNFELTQLPITDIQGDIEVIIVIDKNTDHGFIQDKKLLKKAGFKSG